MPDLLFLALTLACFGALGLLLHGLERSADAPTAHPRAGARAGGETR